MNIEKPIFRQTALLVLCLMAVTGVCAESFDALRSLAAGRTVQLPANTQIEGVIISDWRSMNMELNPNITPDRVDLGQNLRTAYIQSADGRLGFRLLFDGIYDNRLERNGRVRLNLGGCRITGDTEPVRYTISGLKAASIEVLERDVPPVGKERRIAELTDEDLYTLVALRDAEFMSKQGAYTNVYEPSVQRTWLNAFDKPLRYADGWASLLKDAANSSIYLLVNTKCTWRRGTVVPQGVGAVTGIVVHTPMRRYGGDMGRYSIRPRDEADMAIPRAAASSYESVAEWNWNQNKQAAIRFEKGGCMSPVAKEGVADDRVLPDLGEGFLSTTSGARMRLDTDYDLPDAGGTGMRANGALRLDSNTHDWYQFDNRGRVAGTQAIVVECSTAELAGRGLSFDFSFLAGNHNINCAWGFPQEWRVEYAADGEPFADAGRIFVLRSIFYTAGTAKELGKRALSYDAALGFSEYSVPLPTSLLGRKSVVVRLSPASPRLATIPENPADDSAGGVVTQSFSQPFVLRLGTMAVRVLK